MMAMSEDNYKCPFYTVIKITKLSKELTGNQPQVPRDDFVPCCMHKHSPAPVKNKKPINSGNTLHCKGDIKECPIPMDKIGDPR